MRRALQVTSSITASRLVRCTTSNSLAGSSRIAKRLLSDFNRADAPSPLRRNTLVNPGHVLEDPNHKCLGCGTNFHSDKASTPGYNPIESGLEKPRSVTSIKIARDQHVQNLVKQLGADKVAYLNSIGGSRDAISDTNSAMITKEQKLERKEKMAKTYCTWCRDSISSKETWIKPAATTKQEVLDQVPPGSTIIHVCDALDFPASVNLGLIKWAKVNMCKILWVVNKCDLLVPDHQRAETLVTKYVRTEFRRMSNGEIDPQNIFCIKAQGKKQWAVDSLYDALGKDNYLVGYTNVGKTTLALKLARHYRKKNISLEGGSRTWPNPFVTQERTTFALRENKFVTDMPSLPESDVVSIEEAEKLDTFASAKGTYSEYPSAALGPYALLRPKAIRSIVNGMRVFDPPGRYKTNHVKTRRPHNVVSIGGLVALRQRTDHKMLVWSVIPDSDYSVRTLSSLEKVPEINSSSLKVHDRWSIVRPEFASQKLKRIQTFKMGNEGASIVIRGIGMAHVQLHGSLPEGELVDLEVFALPNIRVERRGDLLLHVSNPTSSKMWQEKRARMMALEDTRLQCKYT